MWKESSSHYPTPEILFEVIPLESSAHFYPSLPCFKRCWKDSSEVLFSYVVITLLMAFMTSKQCRLMISKAWEKEKSYTKQDQVNREVILVRRYISARNWQMLSTPSPVTSTTYPNLRWWFSKHCLFSYSADLRKLKQSTVNLHTPPALPAWRRPQSCLLKAPRSSNHLSPPFEHF